MDGVINPVQAIKQMIQRIQGKGGTVIYPVEFLGLEKNKMGINAKTSHGLIKADKIIVLNKGKIVSVGNHSELLKNSPVYKNLYSKQLSAN